ncbi:hypothetical protein BBJ28_00010785 [Nothophytophthora sp. Chile5]|nr:hypothetical protein BBJ28_00010785 [Nothophytophthora sp. Chile5]
MQQLKEDLRAVRTERTGGEEEDDDGLGYTFQVDRSTNPTAKSLRADFSPSTIVVNDREQVESQLKAATSVFRFLRNACAACRSNQDACRTHELIQLAHDMVDACCFWVDVEDDALVKLVVLLSQVALQFCVNCVTGNDKNQALAWEFFFPDHFQVRLTKHYSSVKILVECHQHRKIVAFTVALILNCVNSSHAETEPMKAETDAARRVDLVSLRMMRSSASQTLPHEEQHIDDQDPAFEWICMLFSVLFHDGHAKDLYNAVGAHMLSKLWSRVTPEQLILLRMFTMWLVAASSGSQDAAKVKPALPVGTYEFVINTWTYIVTMDDEDRPEEAEEVRKQMWMELENEAKVLLLDVLGELSLDRTTQSDGRTRELLLSLLQELQRVWELGRLNPKPRNTRSTAVSAESPAEQPSTEPFGYRSGLIRVVGNLSFRHSAHQDLVRDEGYLPLFLNHCNIDETNPLIREWSLVALRNLCEGNEANQSYISALRPQGMDSASSVALEKAQMHAEVDDDGKIKLKKNE